MDSEMDFLGFNYLLSESEKDLLKRISPSEDLDSA